MKNIFKTSKRSIAAILTLCILLGIAGTCIYAASVMPEENKVATEQTIVAAEETTQELVPVMATRCGDHTHTPGAVITETRTCSCGKTFVYQYQTCAVCGCLLRVLGKCCN